MLNLTAEPSAAAGVKFEIIPCKGETYFKKLKSPIAEFQHRVPLH